MKDRFVVITAKHARRQTTVRDFLAAVELDAKEYGSKKAMDPAVIAQPQPKQYTSSKLNRETVFIYSSR